MSNQRNKPKLSRRIIINLLLTTLLSIGLLGFFWIQSEYSNFQTESNSMRARYLSSYKDFLKTEVGTVLSYIEYQRTRVEPRLRQSIQDRVNEAHAIALNIFNQNQGKRTPADMQEMVKDALRPIRFNEGHGYFFAFNLQGIEMLFADRPEMEGKDMLPVQGAQGEYVVRDMLDIVKKEGEGFYRYSWTKPNREGHFPKIAFVKVFEPFGWVFGTGEYLDDVEGDIQKEVVEFIEKIRFGGDGYVFVGQWDGVSLCGPGKGTNMWDVTDSHGTKIVQEMIRLAKEGSGYLEYVMPKLENRRPAPKLSYAVGIPEWQWYVGTGIYIDEIEIAIGQKKNEVDQKIAGNLVKIVSVLVGIIGFVCLTALHFSRKTGKNLDAFTVFFERAGSELNEINPDEMHYAELQNLAYSANDMVRARKRTEQELIRSHAVLKTILERSPFGVVVIGSDRKIRWVNHYVSELVGEADAASLCGKECDVYLCQALQNECPIPDKHQEVDNAERILRHPDGHEIPILNSVIEIEMNGEPVLLETFVDITERKRAETEKAKLEAQLQQAQKFEAIGTLAGGIAHDFNNLLMGIQGRASLLSLELETTDPRWEHIHAIEEYIRSAANLTKQLLGFARGGKYEVKPIDMNKLVLGSSAMFGRTKKEIRIHTKCHQSALTVEADRGQIGQVLLNMYVNAWQAMPPDGGELYLETKIVTLDAAYCKPHQAKPGHYVKVTITDTGSGMDNATRLQIFDPFFTTKEKGRGTGLGLASAYGIIKNHGGMITVYSEIGHGTTFNIYLPASDKKVHQEVRVEGGLIKGSATILLVDDEEMIMEVGQIMLEKLGYRVVAARGGQEAVKVITDMGAEIDLVILDMIMPGMDGGKTFDRIREVQPGVPVLLSSGYAMNGQAFEIMQRGCNGFIQKPYNISELSSKVHNAIVSS